MRRSIQRLREMASSEEGAPLALFAMIWLTLAVLKIWLGESQHLTGGDGGYYANVASHVRDGDGLVTDLSLMHKGYPTLPHPTAVYPGWPLLYGYSARIFGLYEAGVWLPTLAYMVSLGFAYLWGAQLFPGRLLPGLPAFNGGHLAALMLGLDREYAWFTSLPYTEGPAYALLFAALWRSRTWWNNPGVRAGFEAGALAGLMFVTRSQLLLFMMAIWATGAGAFLVGNTDRKRLAAMLLIATVIFVGAVIPWYVRTSGFVTSPGLAVLLRFDLARGTETMSALDVMVQTRGPIDYFLDRGRGVVEAFKLSGRHSYAHHFWAFQYALPASLAVVWARGLQRSGFDGRVVWRRASESQNLWLVFQAVFALAGLISIHLIHKSMWHEWNFHTRHSLTCLFAFFFALVFLLRHKTRFAVLAGQFVLAASVYGGVAEFPTLVREARVSQAPFRPQLTAWIRARATEKPDLVVASKFVQRIWHETPGVGYHQYYDHTSINDLEAAVREFDIDFLVVRTKDKPAFMKDKQRFLRLFQPVTQKSDCRIFSPRPPGARASDS